MESSRDDYGVFLSFRGPDTRHMFTDALYHTMVNAGIRVFRDDNELAVGDEIGANILLAIQNSEICVPIFSKTFAQSKWCLMEVSKMVELNKVVVPIFYDVTPDDVKGKTEVYTELMAEHENAYGKEKRQEWDDALKAITKFKGREVDPNKGLMDFCINFVEKVLNKLKPAKRYKIDPLVGIEDQLESAMELLDIESDGVRYISIHGMGGIGKTTLAKTIFDKISSRFKYYSFLENIRECSSGPDGIENLRRKLEDSLDPTSSSSRSRGISEMLCKKKILLILDDVDKMEQIKELIGEPSLLGSGSRIIITTRCNDILTRYATPYGELAVHTFEMRLLGKEQALELFSRYAFGKASPPADFSALSENAVLFAGGLPLALAVIGSSLCTDKKDVWQDVIARLKEVPAKEVKQKLKISYDTLEDEQKQVFLDIACFLVGVSPSYASYMWESCNFYPTYALEVLESRCLIKIGENGIWMHDQVKDLGRNIVREESIQHPAKRSRLQGFKDALEVLISKEPGKQTVQALYLDGFLVENLTGEHLDNFRDIRFLGLTGGNFRGEKKDLLGNLRWLQWHSTPADFNLSNFSVKKLVILDLSRSSVDENWAGWSQIQMAHNLKVLGLSGCHRLTRLLDFAENNSLERLNLSSCSGLATIGSSIRNLTRLKFLNLSFCSSLRAFPEELCSLTDLQEILMRGCGASVETSSYSSPESFYDRSSFESIPSSLGDLKSLVVLDLSSCWGLSELPDSIGGLAKLEKLLLAGCSKIKKLPDSLWQLTSLLQLDFSYSQVRQLPDSVGDLQQLQRLNIRGCKRITALPASIGRLKKLVYLDAGWCRHLKEIPVEIGDLSGLRRLDLSTSAISRLPAKIRQLRLLQELNLEYCQELQELPELPPGLTELRAPACCLKKVHDQSQLDMISCLTVRRVDDLEAIQRFPTKIKTLKWQCKTSPFDLSSLTQLENPTLSPNTVIPNSRLPIGLSGLKNLSYLELFDFSEGEEDAGLEILGVREMEKLRSVKIVRCSHYAVELCLARTLTALVISDCRSLSKLPVMSHLKALSHLEIGLCPVLTEVLGLEELESLSTFLITRCSSIKRIGDLSKLKNLSYLCIETCHALTWIEGFDKLFNTQKSIINCPRLRSATLPESLLRLIIRENLFRWSPISCLLALICFMLLCLALTLYSGRNMILAEIVIQINTNVISSSHQPSGGGLGLQIANDIPVAREQS